MQSVGCVRRKLLKSLHVPDFWRYSDETASVKHQVLNGFQFRNSRRECHDLDPMFPLHFTSWREFFPSVAGCHLDQIQESLPGITTGVLTFGMQPKVRPSPILVLGIEAIAFRPIFYIIQPISKTIFKIMHNGQGSRTVVRFAVVSANQHSSNGPFRQLAGQSIP